MTKKLKYCTPTLETWPIRMEGPLCASGDAESNGLTDYDLLNSGDITWDIMSF